MAVDQKIRASSVWPYAALFAAVTAAIFFWTGSILRDVGDYRTVRIFLSLFLFQDHPAALATTVVLILALVPIVQRCGLRLALWAGQHAGWLACATAAGLAVGSRVAYHAYPLSMDEFAATFQAQTFAAGHLYATFPAELLDWLVPRGFQGYFFAVSHDTGRLASIYWPGWALLLAPFAYLGIPWLANPILGGLAVWLAQRLALSLTGDVSMAGLAALLTVASPAVTINAISFYSMPAHLVCNSVFALLLLQPTPRRCLAAGAVGSLALVLHNPLPHLLFASPWLLWLAARRDRWRNLPAIVMGYLPLCLLIGFGWPHVLAQLKTAPAGAAMAAPADPGFVQTWLHRLAQIFQPPALNLLEDRLMGLAKLWLWAVPGLPLLSAIGAARCGHDVRCRLFLWSLVATFIGYLYVPFDQGHGWGFRYAHSAWIALPLLALRAFGDAHPDDRVAARGTMRGSLHAYVAGCAVVSAVLLTPYRALQVDHFIAAHLAQVPTVGSALPKLVVVRWQRGYYAADLVQNEPFLRNTPVYIVSRGSELDESMMQRRFPGLTLLAESPTASVWGVPVTAGPAP